MIIREEYALPLVEKNLLDNVTAVIIGTTSQEERCGKIKDIFQNSNAKIISVDYDNSVERFSVSVLSDRVYNNAHPTKENFAGVFANKISGNTKSILIDLTSLQHSVIIVLLNIICNQIRPAHLFATYVKPQQYINRDNLGYYSFSSQVSEPAGIPGLIRQRKEHEIIIPFLGFEGDRLYNIVDSDNMTYESIIPIIGFPSENPTWQFEALRNCMKALDSACPDTEIRKCKSNSIFDALAVLDEIKELYPDKNFVLLPLGIRPHTAACGLWAAKNKNARILYDYVTEADQRSIGIGEAIVYHLSRFI